MASAARCSSPPGIGCGTPVVVGRLKGSPSVELNGEIAEGLRLKEIAVPAHRLDRFDGDAQLLVQALHEMRVAPPAAGDEPALRRARNMAQGGDDGLRW